jgi:drug/metabolite transporter (DMT)-like permease
VPPARIVLLVFLSMLAFAANSVLCRLALSHTLIDPASFTAIRLLSGTIFLGVVVWIRSRATSGANPARNGNWISALALLAYAVGFSFAYIGLSAATGALLLFGAVQATMLGVGIARGERLNAGQILGILLAIVGLVALLLPGLSAPPLFSAALMVAAGVAWGVYSLRGQGAGDSTKVTAGNFLRATPAALLLCVVFPRMPLDQRGLACAILSGALASGLGYTLWYAVLPSLKSTTAAVVQLSVPVIATLSGSALLQEPITRRVTLASCAILGGIAIVVLARRRVQI